MTTTILAAFALALAPAAKPEFQAQTDYGQALKRAADEKKPMAVLIGKGDVFAKVLTDAGLSADAKAVLRDKFVCVSVDVNTDAGKALAGQFQLTDGLVISSAGGTYQALRQAGEVSAADLAKHTATYANAASVPASTVTAGTASTSFYYSDAPGTAGAAPIAASAGYVTLGGCANGTCGTAVPTSGCVGGSCGTVVSSCPGGNCGAVVPSSCSGGNCGTSYSSGRGRLFRR